jgi:outer membrane protein OmpA-like peptidoglycan-associated protein
VLRVSSPGYHTREVAVDVPRDAQLRTIVELDRSGARQDGTEITTDQEIRFALDSAAPLPESDIPLDDIASLLLGEPSIELVRIEGHADAPGTSRYNLDLSLKRAQAVKERLVALGVAPERLEVVASGESARGVKRAVTFTVLVWRD